MRTDWWSCDGRGVWGRSRPESGRTGWPDSADLSRRSVLASAMMGAVAWLANRTSALAQVSLSEAAGSGQRETLVVVFLRGGADGLNVVVPYGEDAYHRLRPSLSLKAPGDNRADQGDRVLDLDGFFGLNPALEPIYDRFRRGDILLLHAVGSQDQTRSHFEAMSAMERGLASADTGAASGWLARYLNSSQRTGASPMRAVAIGPVMPDSLRGASQAVAIDSVDEFALVGADRDGWKAALRELYGSGDDPVSAAGRDTLRVLDALNHLDPGRYQAENGAAYPDSPLGRAMRQVAMLAKAGVGLETACCDMGGWDTHVAQGRSSGWLTGLLSDVGHSLAAFQADMGTRMERTTVVVMTEFGRRAYENQGLGTDHGRGSFMLVAGGSVKGGRVVADWPGLERDQLEGGEDLRVTTDYRAVLSEILQVRLGFSNTPSVFPGFSSRSTVGLYA